ncbi:hypothetical protein MOQ_008737, partial [Trypanosoma cruzi marinkellei]
DVRLAFALFALGLRENNLMSSHVWDGGNTAMSNSAGYYGLVEEERGAGEELVAAVGMSLLPGRWRRMEPKPHHSCQRQFDAFVRVMEGVAEMPVACTLRVADGSRLVDDRFPTKILEERCTLGGFETRCLAPIDGVVRDAVLQWQFSALLRRLCVLYYCQFVSAVEELMAYGAGVASTESSTFCFRNITLSSCRSRRVSLSCWESCGCAWTLSFNLFAETMKCSVAAHRRCSMAVDRADTEGIAGGANR